MGFICLFTLGGGSGADLGDAKEWAFLVGDSSVEESESELVRLRLARARVD